MSSITAIAASPQGPQDSRNPAKMPDTFYTTNITWALSRSIAFNEAVIDAEIAMREARQRLYDGVHNPEAWTAAYQQAQSKMFLNLGQRDAQDSDIRHWAEALYPDKTDRERYDALCSVLILAPDHYTRLAAIFCPIITQA